VIINIIWKIDFSQAIDLLTIEDSSLTNEAKQARKLNIVLEHHEKREPYIKLRNDRWQEQYRRPLAA
jgi:hypothetical protein